MSLHESASERRGMHISRALQGGSCYGVRSGEWFILAVPHHRDWPRAALDLGGKYLSRSGRWRFPGRLAVPVARCLLRLYGWPVFSRWPSHYAPVLIRLTQEDARVSPRPVAVPRTED